MPSPTLSQVVDAQFEKIALQLDDEAERVIYKPGVEGLHALLDGCRNEACDVCMSADTVSTISLMKIFEDRSWSLDMSFKRADLLSLLEVLRSSEPDNTKSARCISDLVIELRRLSAANQFPLLLPAIFTGNTEKTIAQQTLQLVRGMDEADVQRYIDCQKKRYFQTAIRCAGDNTREACTLGIEVLLCTHARVCRRAVLENNNLCARFFPDLRLCP